MAYSFREFTHATPSNANYSFSFPYINKSDIKVSVNEVESAYEWIAPNTINVIPEPALGSTVRVFRDTRKSSRVVDFQDGSTINEVQLDLSALQLFYLIQESLDRSDSSVALTSGAWDGQGFTARNFGDPEQATDLVTLGWLENSEQTFLMQAKEAAAMAELYKDQLQDLTVSVVNVPNGTQGAATYDAITGVLTLHIPLGATGEQGPAGVKGATGDKGPVGDTPSGLAFGQMTIDDDGYLCLEYVGDDLNTAFEIDDNGDLYAEL